MNRENMHKEELLVEVEEEMERMKKAIKSFRKRLTGDHSEYLYNCKESGQIRRTSMDLSRVLVKLRKPYGEQLK